MDLGVISVRYARALLKSATALKIEDSVCQDMMCLGRSYIEVPQLRTAIATPMLQPEKKELLLTDEYYTDMISYVTKSFDMNRILEAMKSK